MIVFAITLVAAQLVGGFIMYELMMARFMNVKYLKKMTKKFIDVSNELVEEMEENF
jgi:hypothetical protein